MESSLFKRQRLSLICVWIHGLLHWNVTTHCILWKLSQVRSFYFYHNFKKISQQITIRENGVFFSSSVLIIQHTIKKTHLNKLWKTHLLYSVELIPSEQLSEWGLLTGWYRIQIYQQAGVWGVVDNDWLIS